MKSGSTVQVAGSFNIPAILWPGSAGLILCILSPIALGLEQANWQGGGRFGAIAMLLRFVGPVILLAAGVSGLIFAFAARQAQKYRRRDLEIGEGGFVLIDREGRREYSDEDVIDLGFRSRPARPWTAGFTRGLATLQVDGREGPERIELAWEYADGSPNPLEGWLNQLLDRAHDRASRAIDRSGLLVGDGWEASRTGLHLGKASELIPFEEITLAEYHEGQLRIWTGDNPEPSARIEEGSKNEAVLFAIISERMPPIPDSGDREPEGLGRILLKRPSSFLDRFALWLLCSLLALPFLVGAAVLIHQRDLISSLAVVPLAIAFVAYLPAWDRQVRVFRCHERGVSQKGLFGDRELPFEDLDAVKVTTPDETTMVKIRFKPIPRRGRKSISFYSRQDDPAIETLRQYVPGGITIP